MSRGLCCDLQNLKYEFVQHMNNTEIEKKFIVPNKQKIIRMFEQKGTRVYKRRQIDEYYIPQHRDFLKEKHPFEWLRLRIEKNACTLTYKYWHAEGSDLPTYCDEFETSIGNRESFEQILKALDFKKVVVVDKVRIAYEIDNFEIAVDDIKGLGTFVEVEIKKGYDSVKDAMRQIDEFAQKLNLEEISDDHPVRLGYALALYRSRSRTF